jgi:hypothetical protein
LPGLAALLLSLGTSRLRLHDAVEIEATGLFDSMDANSRVGRLIIVVGRNDPVRDVDDALETVKGFKVRIYIQAEKELMTQSRYAVLRKPRGDHSLGRCGLLSSISARMARSCNRSTVSVSI